MRFKRPSSSTLKRKSRRGFRGYPIATIAFYGSDDQRASKVAVCIISEEGAEPFAIERWFSEDSDLRSDRAIAREVEQFVRGYEVKSVVMPDRIIGCPHEEGKDYQEGEVCPRCPFWAHRNRWTGEIEG